MLSPGNFERLERPLFAPYRNSSLFAKLMGFGAFLWGNEMGFLPLSAIIIGGFLWSIYKKEFTVELFVTIGYFILFQLRMMAFLFSSVPPPRALTASVVLLCVSSMSFLDAIHISIIKKGIVSILIILCAYSSIENCFLFIKQYEIVMQRKEATKNSTEPVFNKYCSSSGKYFSPNSLDDMDVDWVVGCFRRRHKVTKVTLK